eukprot:UN12213
MECKGNDIVYHCDENNECSKHKYGYDLCVNCIGFRQRVRTNSTRIRQRRAHKNDLRNKLDITHISGAFEESIVADLDNALNAIDLDAVLEKFKERDIDNTQTISY